MSIHPDAAADRACWVHVAERLARPVLEALAARELRRRMPVEAKTPDRPRYTHLEALGRLLAGLAPWLEHGPDTGDEGALRRELLNLARQAIAAGVEPDSPDRMNFTEGRQPVVNAAFLAQALLRAPTALRDGLTDDVRGHLVDALTSTRRIRPAYNNWLLFGATVEAALHTLGQWWDPMRVDYALMQHEQWYVGDGWYRDGTWFHWDYYNSFVILPMMLEVLDTLGREPIGQPEWSPLIEKVRARARRHAAIQERLISPEGTFPPIGRSLAYRFGALQLLSQMALRRDLPDEVTPAQVRCALTAVIRRMTEAPGTFDAHGFLRIGFCGHQPDVGETYISTGSLYLCSTGLVALGLPADDPFWADPPADWTARKAWTSQPLPADHALHEA